MFFFNLTSVAIPEQPKDLERKHPYKKNRRKNWKMEMKSCSCYFWQNVLLLRINVQQIRISREKSV
jgi:hypothetical protein